MVNFGTLAAHSIPPSANEVVVGTLAGELKREPRGQHIQQLRAAIEGGHYRVSAGDLADAFLRASRAAN